MHNRRCRGYAVWTSVSATCSLHLTVPLLRWCICRMALSIKKHETENRIPFWPSVKRTWQILCIPFRTFLLFNAVCIGICNSLLDLSFKRSYLAFEVSDLDGVFNFVFAFLWTIIKKKKKKKKIKISKLLVKNMFFIWDNWCLQLTCRIAEQRRKFAWSLMEMVRVSLNCK